MKSICVYCGSATGAAPDHAAAARRVGRALAERGVGLVYGGGRIGLMGACADAALEGGGMAVGVIPAALSEREVAHGGLTELHVVDDMHQRKALMAARADGFLTLPGGIGTFEEFFETLTWAALGLHRKPIGLLNVRGYFGPLLAMLDHAVAEGFLKAKHLRFLIVEDSPEAIIDAMLEHLPPEGPAQRIDLG